MSLGVVLFSHACDDFLQPAMPHPGRFDVPHCQAQLGVTAAATGSKGTYINDMARFADRRHGRYSWTAANRWAAQPARPRGGAGQAQEQLSCRAEAWIRCQFNSLQEDCNASGRVKSGTCRARRAAMHRSSSLPTARQCRPAALACLPPQIRVTGAGAWLPKIPFARLLGRAQVLHAHT